MTLSQFLTQSLLFEEDRPSAQEEEPCNTFIVMIPPVLLFTWVTLCWGKRNTQTSWGLMDTGYELILIPKDLKCHHVPLVRIGAGESPILNGLLVYVEFRVAALSLQNHSVVIFLISEYIMWKDILMVGTSPILVPWPVESELFVNKKGKWKLLKPPSPSLARIVNENIIAS